MPLPASAVRPSISQLVSRLSWSVLGQTGVVPPAVVGSDRPDRPASAGVAGPWAGRAGGDGANGRPRVFGISSGLTTPRLGPRKRPVTECPFVFESGYALYAKQTAKPFPASFLAPATGSDDSKTGVCIERSDCFVSGQQARGVTNGDDAVVASDCFLAVADGVGAWSLKEKGHAGLWSRLVLHFWDVETENSSSTAGTDPDMIATLDRAFEQTKEATRAPVEWHGTTTASSALILPEASTRTAQPQLVITQIGDSRVMVIRPRTGDIIFRTTEQWHWFDCPRQLGTNSPDSPRKNGVVDQVAAEEGDVVLAMSDGVLDNLWDHEIVTSVVSSLQSWDASQAQSSMSDPLSGRADGQMKAVAEDLVVAAKAIATNPFAESPYMERAIDEGLSIEGGKPDDISVVAALCRKRS